MGLKSFHTALLLGAAALGMDAASAILTPAYAQEATRIYAIEPQELDDALREFGRQTGRDILFAPDTVAGKRSPGVAGEMTERQALEALLAGTGLRFQQTASNGYAVQDPSSPTQPGAADAASSADEEIVVTGTRIRGTQNSAAPTRTIGREEIERGGFSTVEGVVQSIPENFAEISSIGGAFQDGTSSLALGNSDYASAANLRGLGAESTLTLLNGGRRAGSSDGRIFDLSTIPLLAVDRIEVVTGGRSAIYGADAVAGVVNVITRRRVDGVEAAASYGFADSGGERLQFSAIGGTDYSRGGIVAAYDYQQELSLNAVEAGLTRPNFGNVPLRLDTQPETERHSVYLSGTFEPSEIAQLFFDVLWTSRSLDTESISVNAGAPFFATNPSSNVFSQQGDIYSVSGGARFDVGRWQIELAGTASGAETDESNENVIDLGAFGVLQSEGTQTREASTDALTLVFDGPLPEVGNITPRAAFGAEYRAEDYVRAGQTDFGGFVTTSEAENDRTVQSVFAELLLPLVDTDAQRLEVSLAGRYDRYSDFGDTFNPQAGVLWSPTNGFAVRASYASAFRAPALADLVPSSMGFILERTDPLSGSGFSPVLTLQGANPNLEPEEADTWTAGFDWEPSFARWARISASYFDVEYEGRINIPALGADDFLVLEREDRYGTLINRSPTMADIDAINAQLVRPIDNFSATPWDPSTQTILDAFPDLIVFDNRLANISSESARGIDLNVDGVLEMNAGELIFGANVTYTLEHEANVTAASPAVSRLNEVGKPVDLRARAMLGWETGPYSAVVFVNYVDEYENPFTFPSSEMESWTTVDLSLRFDSSDQAGSQRGFAAALTITNLFEADPPELLHDNGRFFAYDPTNANGFGRYITLSIRSRW